MQTEWVWDKPGFDHLTAEARVADMCATSPDIAYPLEPHVVCNVNWAIPGDLYILFRGASQTTCTIHVYTSLADAQAANANWTASASEIVADLTQPHDFALTIQGTGSPNVLNYHVATLPEDLTPANEVWSVWKVPGVTVGLGMAIDRGGIVVSGTDPGLLQASGADAALLQASGSDPGLLAVSGTDGALLQESRTDAALLLESRTDSALGSAVLADSATLSESRTDAGFCTAVRVDEQSIAEHRIHSATIAESRIDARAL